jgi:hypothetical protein
MGNTSTSAMKLIVLTPEPISAQNLRDALPAGVEPEDTEVMVVAPALHENALHFWASDADEAIGRAEAVSRESLERLDAAGIPASADTGEGDLMTAVQDALATFAADRIVIFSHAPGEQRYREEIDVAELQERFGLPVDRAQIPAH